MRGEAQTLCFLPHQPLLLTLPISLFDILAFVASAASLNLKVSLRRKLTWLGFLFHQTLLLSLPITFFSGLAFVASAAALNLKVSLRRKLLG